MILATPLLYHCFFKTIMQIFHLSLFQITTKNRYYHSARHTIQRDPLKYNDEIASYFGAKPELLKHPSLAWRYELTSLVND